MEEKGIFSKVKTVNTSVIIDQIGYIEKLLSNIEKDLSYEEWLSLVSILKYEIDDEDVAYDIFDKFSQQFDSYNSDECFNKFYNSKYEGTGDKTIGSLIFYVKEYGTYNQEDYSEFYGQRDQSVGEVIRERGTKKVETLHITPEDFDITGYEVPEEISALDFLEVIDKDATYATCTNPTINPDILDLTKGNFNFQQYISVNPLVKGATQRIQENIASFKFAVVEFDDIEDKNLHIGIMAETELPIECIVDTANKSLHAWVRIDAGSREEYVKRTRIVGKLLTDLGYKPDTRVLYDCCSWVRCPGVTRVDWKNGNEVQGEQTLILHNKGENWDSWYRDVYPKFLSEPLVEEVKIELPEGCKNKKRKAESLSKLLKTDDVVEEFRESLREAPDVEVYFINIMEYILSALGRTKRKVVITVDDLYSIFIDATLEELPQYEGCVATTLYKACLKVAELKDEEKAKVRERLKESFESIYDAMVVLADERFLAHIDRTMNTMDTEEDLDKLKNSVLDVFTELELHRGVILYSTESYKDADPLGKMANEIDRSLYCFEDRVSHFDTDTITFSPINPTTFASRIANNVAFVSWNNDKCRYSIVEVRSDRAAKLLESHVFKGKFRPVDLVSQVPIFYEKDGETFIAKGYNKDIRSLITGDPVGYDFLSLEEAKKIILDLFRDFNFLCKADKSRAVASLLLPAICHSKLLRNGNRPIVYVDANEKGTGKSTLLDLLTLVYEDSPFKGTVREGTGGSLDEQLSSGLISTGNLILLDNIRATRNMKELGSPFFESILTSDNINTRIAFKGDRQVDCRWAIYYVTTNGIILSEDTATRAWYISLRKQDENYQFPVYEKGFNQWVLDSRPKIMSAIYTILKEYVEQGCPMKTSKEYHRFTYTNSIMNWIITEIFGLEDISIGQKTRVHNASDSSTEIVRQICYSVESLKRLDEELCIMELYEVLRDKNKDHLLGIHVEDMYADDDCTIFSAEAKRVVARKLSLYLSKNHLLGPKPKDLRDTYFILENYKIVRTYVKTSKSPRFIITLTKGG